jgi:uncharacterized protein (TIGR03435 family)
MIRPLATVGVLALLASASFGQSPAAPAAFDIADVHASTPSQFSFFQGGLLRGDRYILRNATLVDLIATAYGVDNDKVVGGPAWLEKDRFDVVAKTVPSASPDSIKLMLQALLADRFKLVVHNDTKPLSVFVLSLGKGKPKLKESDGSASTGCQPVQNQQAPQPGTVQNILVACHGLTMDVLAQTLRQFAGGYLNNPVVNSTGLAGSWDFEIKWTGRGQLAQAGSDRISIFDAVDKQLGLKLEPQKTPLPVIVVDSANEKPTDNPPGITAALPAPKPAEFEVAVIKPSLPDATLNGRIDPSGQVNLQGVTLKFLITFAWNFNPNDNHAIVGAPKWLDSAKFDIIAKPSTAAPVANAGPNSIPFDIDELRAMLRALLIERFKMVVHTEERPINAYTLVAANPKLKKADPLNRTGCKEGPGPDGKDPRIANPILARLVTCLNMTMPQFAEQLQTIAGGYIFGPVQDSTGLEGAWDFTLNFSTAGQVNGGGGRGGGGGDSAAAGGAPTIASDPSGALSLFDAVNKQLGLKLELRKRPMPVLVIDHVEEKPTDN